MNFVIIEPNQINYSDLEKNHTRFKKEILEEDIEDFINIYEAKNSYEGMQSIIEKCGFNHEELLHTTIVYESHKYVYYMIHNVNDKNDKTTNINKIAIYLSKNRFKIYGSVGIIKEEIKPNGDTVISSMNINEILDIYYSNLVFKGIKIDEKGVIDEFKYILNPIDWMKPEESLNYKFFEYEIFDKIIMIFIELRPKNDIFNEKASILLSKKVNGTVYVALRTKIDDIKQIEHVYENLDKSIAEKLIYVLSVNQDDIKESEHERKKMKIVCFHTILEKRYKNFMNRKEELKSYNLALKFKDHISVNRLATDHLNKQVNEQV